MVLTRAQARTQATAQQQETLEAVMVVVDHSDETAVAEVVAERSTVELVPHVQDYPARRPRRSPKFRSAAVRESTDAGIKQLANQQLTITGRFHEELMATHAGIREQFLRLETMQANVGEEIERSVADRLFRALREAHSESQSMIAAQTELRMTLSRASCWKKLRYQSATSKLKCNEAEACNTIKELVKKEVEKRMELVQLQLLTAHPQTGRCTEISDIKVEHDVTG
ncbi:uncharacterized protein PITG_11367 [Phytophthora infestans T30-4]|uniref:Uncharacterized protein n=1 Tax=Phytophthora infestans (strain T30-4) TaxID=403677 RepID=D0NIM2_PHYIT|nr:uncharacterized protein PITG_11367 [Phytophthora infestans T30-4]EEY59356.1 hypothetical protein PITG_11367 [Phytophthora infestans T30-4]|eukprot:XP_002900966.1 hypothetical protein PITG_11367 [Phytophthora infestans T30-4]